MPRRCFETSGICAPGNASRHPWKCFRVPGRSGMKPGRKLPQETENDQKISRHDFSRARGLKTTSKNSRRHPKRKHQKLSKQTTSRSLILEPDPMSTCPFPRIAPASFPSFSPSLPAHANVRRRGRGAARSPRDARRSPRRGPSDARGSSAARSRAKPSGQGSGRWAERRRASEAIGRAQRGIPATRAGRPERVPATRAGRPWREAKELIGRSRGGAARAGRS